MIVNLPHAETLAPAPPLLDVSQVDRDVETVSVYGKARGLFRLKELSRLRTLWVSGLNEAQADIVGSLPELRSLVIHDLRTASLESLSGLRDLERLAICGVSRLKTLDGIQRLENLRELLLVIVTGLQDLEPLSALTDLEVLSIDGGLYKNLRLPSLRPLGGFARLRRLRLAGVSVADRSLKPLHSLAGLREIFVGKPFSERELVALAEALPLARGETLDSRRGDAA